GSSAITTIRCYGLWDGRNRAGGGQVHGRLFGVLAILARVKAGVHQRRLDAIVPGREEVAMQAVGSATRELVCATGNVRKNERYLEGQLRQLDGVRLGADSRGRCVRHMRPMICRVEMLAIPAFREADLSLQRAAGIAIGYVVYFVTGTLATPSDG